MHSTVWPLLLLFAAAPLRAQGPTFAVTGSPEAAAEAALAANASGDWAALQRLAHPLALVEFRQHAVRSLQWEGPLTAFDSCLGAERSGAKLRQAQEAYLRYTLDSVYRVPTLEALNALPPDTVFARHGRHVSDALQARARRARAEPAAGFAQPTYRVLGAVAGGPDLAYVVVNEHYDRLPLPDWPRDRPQLMTFRRVAGEWRSMLDGPIDTIEGAAFIVEPDGE